MKTGAAWLIWICMLGGDASATDASPKVHVYQSGEGGIYANAYLLETAHGVVAIDSTLTNSDSQALHARLAALGKPLLAVLLTHGHPDHYNGITNLIAGAQVPVIATRSVSRVIERDDAAKEAQWRPIFKDEWPRVRTFPNRLVLDGDRLSFDGVTYTVHDLGPGESHADSIWIARGPGLRVAFLGDVVFQGVQSYLSDGHSGRWLRNLDTVRGLTRRAHPLYPGHGEPGGTELLDGQRAYLRAYRDNIAALANGRSTLDDDQKSELERRMLALRPDTRLQFLVKLGADPVARELAASSGVQ
jgi:glyoxylase-like metal-dependent hydrolase (beta-lactamase superfamily II)